MGRYVDRAALLALTATGLYLLFLQAFGSIAVSAGMAFICCVLLLRLIRQGCGRCRMTRFQARLILESWACGSDEEARNQILRLMKRNGKLIYLGKHPSAALGMGDVFSAWKSHRDLAHIVIAAPCHSDGRARTYAATLQNPSVEILDAAKLIPLIRRSSLHPPHVPAGRQFFRKLKDVFAALPDRRPWYKNLASGLGLMLFYLITGNAAYLILSACMLFLAGMRLRIRGT